MWHDRKSRKPHAGRLFAYVPQGNLLMSGTIREVVSFGASDRKEDDYALYQVLYIACADFVEELESSLDTLLGERGTGMSEGQMRRLSIARAIFCRQSDLLLDESTSALTADDKPPVCNFEMHRSLFSPTADDALVGYYLNVKDRLIKDVGNACGYHFSDEDFYIYMIAHEYKHFSGGGTGLRSVLDTYIYCTRKGDQLNWQYIEDETQKLGISDFEKANRSLALHLFGGEELTEKDKEMLDYVFASGTYGTQKNYVENLIRRKGRVGYLFSRVFVSYSSMLSLYPILKKLPILLPLFWIIRIIGAIFKKPKKVLYQFCVAFRQIKK